MSNEMSYEEAKSYSGYLKKKARNVLGSWQKRYFQIIDGKTLIYKKKRKDEKIRGTINLAEISFPEIVEKKEFKFMTNDREFLLKTKHKIDSRLWVIALTIVKNKLIEMGEGSVHPQDNINALDNKVKYEEDSNLPDPNSDKENDSPNTDDEDESSQSSKDINSNEEKKNDENIDSNVNLDINKDINAIQNTDPSNYLKTDIQNNKIEETHINANAEKENNLNDININKEEAFNTAVNANLKTEQEFNLKTEENLEKENVENIDQKLEENDNKAVESNINVGSIENIQQDKNQEILISNIEENKNEVYDNNTKVEAEVNIEIENNEEKNSNIEENKNSSLDIKEKAEPEVNIQQENNEEKTNSNIEENKNEVYDNEKLETEINIKEAEKSLPESNANINMKFEVNSNININESLHPSVPKDVSSSKLLYSKGINKLIDIEQPLISTRFYHDFISIKNNENDDEFQRRWFILFSPRPLFDKNYLEDDTDLDPKMQKGWIKFDTIFYFKYESEDENDQNYESINLVNCDNIEKDEKNNNFYLNLKCQENTYEIFCERKEEWDILYEILRNSRRTVKEYQSSITKRPRNIELINSFFVKGENDFKQKIDKEINAIIGDQKKISNGFEEKLTELLNLIESTLDGCNANSPPKLDLLKSYALYMNKEFFQILKTFWDKAYKEVNIYEILNFSMKLFDLWEGLYLQNIDDPNFAKNGKALIKIYIKKTYKNILSVIENILIEERDKKGLKDKEGKYCTKGPNDLFELFTITLESIKDYKNAYLYESILNLFYYLIRQYLLGEATALTNYDVIIDKEFLISMANNCIIFENLIKSLLEKVKNTNVLSEEEINLSFNLDKIKPLISGISEKSITRLVFNLIEEVGKNFEDASFLSLDISKIIKISNESLEPFINNSFDFISKKESKEMLKLLIYHYMNLLLATKAEDISAEKLKEKIKNDIDIINNAFNEVIGSKIIIKILYDLLDFLNSNLNDISTSCFQLKKYIGSSFNLETLQNLINLRTDFNEQEKNEAIEKCKVLLDKNVENKNPNLSYFNIIEREKKHELEEKIDLNEDIFKWEDFKYDIEEEKIEAQEESGEIIYEGYLDQKIINAYETKYFKLQNGILFSFKNKTNSKIQNKISIKNILKTESNKEKKFIIIVNLTPKDNSGKKNKNDFKRKIYKFSCKTNDERNKWIDEIEKEMKKLKNEGDNNTYKLEIPIKKKVINDYEKLPEMNKDFNYMRKKVLEYMMNEKFFKHSPKGLKNAKSNPGQIENEIGAFDLLKNWIGSFFNKNSL